MGTDPGVSAVGAPGSLASASGASAAAATYVGGAGAVGAPSSGTDDSSVSVLSSDTAGSDGPSVRASAMQSTEPWAPIKAHPTSHRAKKLLPVLPDSLLMEVIAANAPPIPQIVPPIPVTVPPTSVIVPPSLLTAPPALATAAASPVPVPPPAAKGSPATRETNDGPRGGADEVTVDCSATENALRQTSITCNTRQSKRELKKMANQRKTRKPRMAAKMNRAVAVGAIAGSSLGFGALAALAAPSAQADAWWLFSDNGTFIGSTNGNGNSTQIGAVNGNIGNAQVNIPILSQSVAAATNAAPAIGGAAVRRHRREHRSHCGSPDRRRGSRCDGGPQPGNRRLGTRRLKCRRGAWRPRRRHGGRRRRTRHGTRRPRRRRRGSWRRCR